MGQPADRVRVDGKFFYINGRPFPVRGVTYGSFASRLDGWRFPDRAQIKQDLSAMAHAGLNTVRTYTLPPPEILEICDELDLKLLVGLDYHDWRMEPHHGRRAKARILDAGRRAVDEAMNTLIGHPAALGVAVGNEVPVDLVRLHGVGSVEDVLSTLLREVHAADPRMLATYVNYPTTEHLEPEGQDFLAFNVFLESSHDFRRYVRHLKTLSADRPLLLTEFGVAGEIHGEETQAKSLEWQLRVLDEAGCPGGTVFSWTDDWVVDDVAIEGWGFGITTHNRLPKPAFGAVQTWAKSAHPRSLRPEWPRVSVVVCARNEEANIAECLTSLSDCDYPDLEVIVCDDGSEDATFEIARRFSFEVLKLSPMGLAAARNKGLERATGDIVAYLDADARCHRDWPYHLALSLEEQGVVATGGPNLPFPEAGLVERAVALSPGTAAEVLVTADRAEHVPGCNMAFDKRTLIAIGGFDPVYNAAGDDVDVCWKILDAGGEIAFTPAAQVHHHRRATIKSYLRQQRGYGRAERTLACAHPHRFNRLGQARWTGVVYRRSRLLPSLLRPIVYTGSMGMAPFQPIAKRPSEEVPIWAGALLPLLALLAGSGSALAVFSKWWLAFPLAAAAFVTAYALAVAVSTELRHDEPQPIRLRALVGLLHILQPLARTWGRLTARRLPLRQSEQQVPWRGDRAAWIRDLQATLQGAGCSVRPSPSGASWDLAIHRGQIVSARLVTAVAWHWHPRIRTTLRLRWVAWVMIAGGLALSATGDAVGWAVVAATLAWAVIAALTLRRHIESARQVTTRGATE